MRGIHRFSAVGAILATAFVVGACGSGVSSAPASPVSSLPTEASPPPVGEATLLPAPSASFAGPDATSFQDLVAGTELAPDTYVINYGSIGGADRFPTLALTFTVPAGWSRGHVDGVVWGGSGTRLAFVVADNLFVDPCNPSRGLRDPAVGPSVEDLSTALATVPNWNVERTSTGTFHGFPGTRVELTSPADLSACTEAASWLLHVLGDPGVAGAINGSERHDLRILDVDGTRVVIDAISTGESSEAALTELRALVDSIAVQP